ncbi:AMP-binding protein [Pseudochrobactrum sp. sp1633]|uniref:AMP-binding protein n=1 Tax=Pseudochrobactrum sp. sp1633 TaxID=3036706 RepID=UPI0025A6345B|nr:AMP-binding protein [Pseudochrobactrum sp. sp1633]MDM8344469.1 AMP-binding protein [Pseudochrobactrum sp. sp1633]
MRRLSTENFKNARDFLLQHREDYTVAKAGFVWPEALPFNWALDWFDVELASNPQSRDQTALWIVDTATGTEIRQSFAGLSRRSNQVANYLRSLGLKRGDHLLVLLGNVPALWEVMLSAMKLGIIVIPATTLLTADELSDRLERGCARAVLATGDQLLKCEGLAGGNVLRIQVPNGHAAESSNWHDYNEAFTQSSDFTPDGETQPHDPLLLYFTSGTTAKPKLVRHSHRSYPVGSLSTMYWVGLQPADIHLNVSSPGWAKHAWSSFFAPWNAGATVLVINQPAFSAKVLLAQMQHCAVTTLCAPPTVWRMLIQEDLKACKMSLREVVGAGEPLNPEVIDQVREAWGLTIRDGYGQTETTAQVANSPAQMVKSGAMGRPLPGYEVVILDGDGHAAQEGEVCLMLGDKHPAGLMQGYQGQDGALTGTDGTVYRTGDVAYQDEDGYLHFVGRADDVFKCSDYRISPFELESVLLEHDAVTEAAVIPVDDPIRLSVPKAYILLRAGEEPTRETALSVLQYTNERLAPFKRIRSVEFVRELPKTISGKIRRVQLRRFEREGVQDDVFRGVAFCETEFPELSVGRNRARA